MRLKYPEEFERYLAAKGVDVKGRKSIEELSENRGAKPADDQQ